MKNSVRKEDVQLELVKRELARRRLENFVLYTYPNYKMGKFHSYLCYRLQKFYEDVKAGKTPKLMIFSPPRAGKSELVSRRFPAWVFGKDPNIDFIATSYSADLASAMNNDVQKIIKSKEYSNLFPDVTLARRGEGIVNSEKFHIASPHEGKYRSAGVGGGITGMGATIFVIDDPVKDEEEANSETIRNKVHGWYNSTAFTRLAPNGGMLLTMTRWHLDDLAGRLLLEDNGWEVILFPAIAEEDEYVEINGETTLFRKEGEALHPERYDVERLLSIKESIGTYKWISLYMQRPVAEGGNIFKKDWFKYYNYSEPPRCDRYFGSWDMSFKDGKDSSFVVGQVWGVKGSSFYLLHQIRKRAGFVETMGLFLELHRMFKNVFAWLVEDKANGTAIIDSLKTKIPGIIPITPHESKVARAHAISPVAEAGNIFVPYPSQAEWVSEYLDEMCSFPTSKNDDQVDCTSQAMNYILTSSLSIWERLANAK